MAAAGLGSLGPSHSYLGDRQTRRTPRVLQKKFCPRVFYFEEYDLKRACTDFERNQTTFSRGKALKRIPVLRELPTSAWNASAPLAGTVHGNWRSTVPNPSGRSRLAPQKPGRPIAITSDHTKCQKRRFSVFFGFWPNWRTWFGFYGWGREASLGFGVTTLWGHATPPRS